MGFDFAEFSGRARVYRGGFRVGWFESESAGGIYAPDEELQHMERSASLESVRVGGNTSHGMHRDGSSCDGFMFLPFGVSPVLLEGYGFTEGSGCDFGSEFSNLFRWDAWFGFGYFQASILG